jgi:hypothetical protein
MRRRTLSQTAEVVLWLALLLLTGSGRAFNFTHTYTYIELPSQRLVVSGRYAIRGTGEFSVVSLRRVIGGHLRRATNMPHFGQSIY